MYQHTGGPLPNLTVPPGVPWYLLSLLRSTSAGTATAEAARPARARPVENVFMVATCDGGDLGRRKERQATKNALELFVASSTTTTSRHDDLFYQRETGSSYHRNKHPPCKSAWIGLHQGSRRSLCHSYRSLRAKISGNCKCKSGQERGRNVVIEA